jgi:hypothetical protein
MKLHLIAYVKKASDFPGAVEANKRFNSEQFDKYNMTDEADNAEFEDQVRKTNKSLEDYRNNPEDSEDED